MVGGKLFNNLWIKNAEPTLIGIGSLLSGRLISERKAKKCFCSLDPSKGHGAAGLG